MARVLKLRDHAYALLRSPGRRAAAVAALVAVLSLDAYLLHARFRGTSGAAGERSHGGQPTLRELAAARDRSQTGESSPDDPSARDYAWPVPTRPATRDRDAAPEPPRNGPDEASPLAAPAAASRLSGTPRTAASSGASGSDLASGPSLPRGSSGSFHAGQPQVSWAPQRPRPSSQASAGSMSPLGPTSPPARMSPLGRVSPPPSSPQPSPLPPPTGIAGPSGEDEDETAAASAGARSGAATFPEAPGGGTGLSSAGPGARSSVDAEPDDDTAPAPQPSSAFPPHAYPPMLGSMRPPRAGDLNGSWEIRNVVSSTSYPAYRGLRLTYRIVLHQDGERISGEGEKWAENGRRIPAAQRTPIHLSGEMAGREVRVRFTENGAWRDSAGSFRWRLSADGTSCAGTFASTVAGARGVSAAVRVP